MSPIRELRNCDVVTANTMRHGFFALDGLTRAVRVWWPVRLLPRAILRFDKGTYRTRGPFGFLVYSWRMP
jgi:hypothetical protein